MLIITLSRDLHILEQIGVHFSCHLYPSGQGGSNGKWHLNGNYIEGMANTSLNENNYNGFEISEYTKKYPELTINDMMSNHLEVPYPVNLEIAQEAYKSVLLKPEHFLWMVWIAG